MDSTKTSLKPNHIGSLYDPVNISIMDVEAFIHKHHVLPVTSALPFEPSTNNFNQEGLYSEVIFGPVGSPDRMLRFGYIELNTPIFHPKILKIIIQLKSFYKDIMSGIAYAKFNPVIKDFDRVLGNPMDVDGADTGFSFFLKHFYDINLHRTDSAKRDERIAVIEKYKDRALNRRYLVEPAGLRDIINDSSGRLVQDDINKLYQSLLMLSRAIPRGSTSRIYDPARWAIQSKAQEIFEYIENFLDGKRGFIQGSFARRKVAMGTRNVITASDFIALSPDDPQLQKADDVKVGVYQTVKGLQPFTKYAYFETFIKPIFKADMVSKVALSDPVTGKLEYTTISPDVRERWTSSEGFEKLINSLYNTKLRKNPILVRDVEGKDYALALIYDEGDEIALCRSIDDLKLRWPRPIDKKKLRPITYIEMFYMIAEAISAGKHGIVTRYPVIEQGSSYVANIHVVSTTPSRYVEMVDMLSPELIKIPMKEYPVIGASYMDAMMVHPSKLAALGGDHDGDLTSAY